MKIVSLRRASTRVVTLLLVCQLFAQPAAYAQSRQTGDIRVEADAHAAGEPLKHFWSTTVGAGRANEGLRAGWQEQLQMAATEGGFRYVRFHGLFHDDMFVYRRQPDGRVVYNFQYIDDLFDRMLAKNVRPFVELSFSPSDLSAKKGGTGFWWKANGTPPTDYGQWSQLVEHFVRHCIARYGQQEVRSWYFEVWNEPNLEGFWDGTQQQYFDLYKTTAETLKKVDSQLRVGGPATSNFNLDPAVLAKGKAEHADLASLPWQPIWLDDFLRFCVANHLPMDFLSTHPYPMDFEAEKNAPRKMHRSVNSTRDDLTLLRRLIDHSAYPHAEIHLTEWSSSSSSRDHSHDSLPAATFIVKTNIDSIGLVDSLSYWTFTDVFEEQGAGDSVFHGGFGMINFQGIPKPSFHAYRFLNDLGDELLTRTDGAVVTRDRQSGRVTALAWNYPAEVSYAVPGTDTREEADRLTATGSARRISLHLRGLAAGAVFQTELLDATHGNAVAAWEAMGTPEPPTREQTAALKDAAWGTQKELLRADGNGELTITRDLPAWAVLLVRQR